MEKSIKDYFDQKENIIEFKEEYSENDPHFKIISSLRPGKVLSLGCGSGREVKLLVKLGHKVTAVDIVEGMVKESKKIEPKAKYYCEDVVKFSKKNKDRREYDYILGLFTFLCYIPKNEREDLIKNLYSMLKSGGEIIFTVHYIDNNLKDFMKTLISPFLAILIKRKYEEFGDTFFNLGKRYYTLAHHFTKRQIRNLLEKYKYKMSGDEIRIYKDENLKSNKRR